MPRNARRTWWLLARRGVIYHLSRAQRTLPPRPRGASLGLAEESNRRRSQAEPLWQAKILYVHADDLVYTARNRRRDCDVVSVAVEQLAPGRVAEVREQNDVPMAELHVDSGSINEADEASVAEVDAGDDTAALRGSVVARDDSDSGREVELSVCATVAPHHWQRRALQ